VIVCSSASLVRFPVVSLMLIGSGDLGVGQKFMLNLNVVIKEETNFNKLLSDFVNIMKCRPLSVNPHQFYCI